MKKEARIKSSIIGVRISKRTILELKTYCRKNHLLLSDFLKETTLEYIQANYSRRKDDIVNIEMSNLQDALDSTENDLNGTLYYNLRLNKDKLFQWDDFCERNRLNRSELIHNAINWRLFPNKLTPVRDFDRIKSIILNMIRFFGLMSYESILSIFDTIDQNELKIMLNSLEADSFIMRKGSDDYISIGISDRTYNFRLLVENFEIMLNSFGEKSEISEFINRDQQMSILLENESLMIVVFEYLSQFLTRIKQKSFPSRIKSLKRIIDRINTRIMHLFTDLKKNF